MYIRRTNTNIDDYTRPNFIKQAIIIKCLKRDLKLQKL